MTQTLAFNTAIPARKPRTKRQRAQGKRLLDVLAEAGIEADNVTRNRRTGIHTIQFFAANCLQFDAPGTLPASAWARRIEAAGIGATVVDTYQTVAEWRPGKPVLSALVMVRWEQKSV